MAISIIAYRASIGLFNNCNKGSSTIIPCSPLPDDSHIFYRKKEWRILMDRTVKHQKVLFSLSLIRSLIAITLLITCMCSLTAGHSLSCNYSLILHILYCITFYTVLNIYLGERTRKTFYVCKVKCIRKPSCVL